MTTKESTGRPNRAFDSNRARVDLGHDPYARSLKDPTKKEQFENTDSINREGIVRLGRYDTYAYFNRWAF